VIAFFLADRRSFEACCRIGFVLVVVAAGSCDRSFQRAIAPKPFLREAPLALCASGSAWWRQTLIYLLRIPRPMGHSNQRVVLAGWLLAYAAASRVCHELAQRGGISSCVKQLGSDNR